MGGTGATKEGTKQQYLCALRYMCLSVVHGCFSVVSRSLTYNMGIIQSEVQAHASKR